MSRRRRRRRRRCRRPQHKSEYVTSTETSHLFVVTDSTVNTTQTVQYSQKQYRPCRRRCRRPKQKEVAVLSHQIFTKGEWQRARLRSHPRAEIFLTPEHSPQLVTKVQGLADSGAQSDVWSLEAYLDAGYSRTDLQPVSMSLNAANKSPINIDGAFFTEVSGVTEKGDTISHKAMVYVSRDVKGFYLSCSTMLELGMLSPSFPKPG